MGNGNLWKGKEWGGGVFSCETRFKIKENVAKTVRISATKTVTRA